MPTLGDYYLKAGGDPGKLTGLLQFASSGQAAGKSWEQVLREYTKSPTQDDQAAYNQGEANFNSAFMSGNAMNRNDRNAMAIQDWRASKLASTIKDQNAYDNFDWKSLPQGTFQQGGNASTASFGDNRPQWLRDREAQAAAQNQKFQELKENRGDPLANIRNMVSKLSSIQNTLGINSPERQAKQLALLQASATPASNVALSNGSAYNAGYNNNPEGYQPPGTTGVNPNATNPAATHLTNNPYGQNTTATVGGETIRNNSSSNVTVNSGGIGGTVGTNTGQANTQGNAQTLVGNSAAINNQTNTGGSEQRQNPATTTNTATLTTNAPVSSANLAAGGPAQYNEFGRMNSSSGGGLQAPETRGALGLTSSYGRRQPYGNNWNNAIWGARRG